MATLSPPELHSKVDVSIGLAYKYLSSELKMLSVNLSYFPGSFHQVSAILIFDLENPGDRYFTHRDLQLDKLVQRSLLQFSQPTKRFNFHQLIQKYFRQISGPGEDFGDSLQENFDHRFQLHFATLLGEMLDLYIKGDGKLALSLLEFDKHNFQHMFDLFTSAKHANYTLSDIKITLLAIKSHFLPLRFSFREIRAIVRNLLESIESYTVGEEGSEELFLETYAEVLIQAAKQEQLLWADRAVELLSSRKARIDDGYENNHISDNTYIKFYNDLAQYYKENGEDEMSIKCHIHLLKTVHNQLDHCYPNYDYFSISIAYDSVGDSENAFHFRKLSLEHQLSSLNRISQTKLFLDLYKDFSNESLGNNKSRAEYFSNWITKMGLVYLITANESQYMEEVYYDAIDLFRAKNMEYKIQLIQKKMMDVILYRCKNTNKIYGCLPLMLEAMSKAFSRECYYLAIQLGEQSFESMGRVIATSVNIDDHSGIIARIVGTSYYHIGNYSDANIWLNRALQLVNQELEANFTFKLRDERADICYDLVNSGYATRSCYGVLLTEFTIAFSVKIVHYMLEPMLRDSTTNHSQQSSDRGELSKHKDLTLEKYSFVRFPSIQYAIEILSSRANKVHATMREYTTTSLLLVVFRIGLVLLIIFFLFFISFFFAIFCIISMYSCFLCVIHILCCRCAFSFHLKKSIKVSVYLSAAVTSFVFALMFISYLYGGIDITDL